MKTTFFISTMAILRMPEEFNVENDFEEKEKWIHGKSKMKCGVCLAVVADAYDKVGHGLDDDIYDHMDGICNNQALYNKFKINNEKYHEWKVEKVETDAEQRAKEVIRWQSHAMQEACEEYVKPSDDEIKDAFLGKAAILKKNTKKVADRLFIATEACIRGKMCTKQARDEL